MPKGIFVRTKHWKLSPETCHRMSVAKKGIPSPLKGRKISEEHRNNIALAVKKRWENGTMVPGMLGHKHSEETKQKMSMKLRGEKAWNWIADRTLAMRNLRNDPEYKQWRLKVLRRDNYICDDCGEVKKGEMQADHIYLWRDFPRLRYAVENGRTLCKDCHKVRTKSLLIGSNKLVYNY